jgi:hypothetical protein
MGQPILRYESGQTSQPFEEMSDSGDRTTFSASFSPISQVAGSGYLLAPAGLLTGGACTPGSSNDELDVAALTARMPWVSGASSEGVVSVSADTVSITRGITTDTHNITSITINSSGAVTAVSGTDSTSFSETRGAAGGPPFIPVDSIEIAQVRTTSVTAALVTASEIFVVPGTHREEADYPVVATVDYALGTATFAEALPAIHTGSVGKKVYIKGATPIFAPIPKVSDWVPAETTYSINSTDTYDGAIGSSSSSLNQASFSAVLDDGITDNFVGQKGKNIWFEFRPDRDSTVIKQYTLGYLGISRTYPAGGGNVTASCTVTPEQATEDISS